MIESELRALQKMREFDDSSPPAPESDKNR